MSVQGAWQPGGGLCYPMLPKGPLKEVGLAVGNAAEVSFRLLPQDDVDLPDGLAALPAHDAAMRTAWQARSAGKQRGLAHPVAFAKRPETRQARLAQVRGVVPGELPEPWKHRAARPAPGA